MWEADVTRFISRFGVSRAEAKLLRCTAEHLWASSDGGATSPRNIVAACRFCNGTRHKAKNPLPADKFKRYVARRMKRGHWLIGLLPSLRKFHDRFGIIEHSR
jgi:hypothetical protein